MALFLAIETAGTTCGVALFENDLLLAEHSLFIKNVHDMALATLVKQILHITQHMVNDLDAVCISAGPGSFTGLRIGYSFTKGLLFDTKIKLVEVPTLHACASAAKEFAQAGECKSIYSIIGSHKDILYTQKFTIDAEPLSNVQLLSLSEFLELGDLKESVLCGSGANALLGVGKQLSGLNRLTPRFIGKLGANLIEQGLYTDIENAEPLYSQDFIVKERS